MTSKGTILYVSGNSEGIEGYIISDLKEAGYKVLKDKAKSLEETISLQNPDIIISDMRISYNPVTGQSFNDGVGRFSGGAIVAEFARNNGIPIALYDQDIAIYSAKEFKTVKKLNIEGQTVQLNNGEEIPIVFKESNIGVLINTIDKVLNKNNETPLEEVFDEKLILA